MADLWYISIVLQFLADRMLVKIELLA